MRITDENIRELKEVVRRETPRLLRLPGVQEICIGLKERNGELLNSACVRVLVKKKFPPEQINPRDAIRIEGTPTDVIEVGSIAKTTLVSETSSVYSDVSFVCPGDAKRNKKYEMLLGGINIGEEGLYPQGTLGIVVYEDDEKNCTDSYLLSCAHVIGKTASTETKRKYVTQGDDSTSKFRVAETVKSVFKDEIDAATAKINAPKRKIDEGILGVDNLERIFMEPKLDMKVVFSGSFSGKREGAVVDMIGKDTFNIRKKGGFIEDDIIVCSGDSGSVVLGETDDGKLRPIGMLKSAFYYPPLTPTSHWGTAIKFSAIVNHLGIRLDRYAGWFHRFWNHYNDTNCYINLSSGSLNEAQLSYEYKGPAFIGTHPDNLDSAPLYNWFNPVNKQHYYSTEGLPPTRSILLNRELVSTTASGISTSDYTGDYIFLGQSGYVNTKPVPGMVELYSYINQTHGSQILLTKSDIQSGKFSDYQLENSDSSKKYVNPDPKTASEDVSRFIIKLAKDKEPKPAPAPVNMSYDYVPDMLIDYHMGKDADISSTNDPRYGLGALHGRGSKNTAKRWSLGVKGWMLFGFTGGFVVSEDRHLEYVEIGNEPECVHVYVAVKLTSSEYPPDFTVDRPVDYQEYNSSEDFPYPNSTKSATQIADGTIANDTINSRPHWLGDNWKRVGTVLATGKGKVSTLELRHLPQGTYYYMLIQDASNKLGNTDYPDWAGPDLTHIGVYPTPAQKKHYLLIIDDSGTVVKTKKRYKNYISTFLQDIYKQPGDIYLGVRLIRWKPGMRDKVKHNKADTDGWEERTMRLQFEVDGKQNWLKIKDIQIESLATAIKKVSTFDGNETPFKQMLDDIFNIDINKIKNHKGDSFSSEDNLSLKIISDGLPDPFLDPDRNLTKKEVEEKINVWSKIYNNAKTRKKVLEEISKDIKKVFQKIVNSVGKKVMRSPTLIGDFTYTGKGDAVKMGGLIQAAYSKMKDADDKPMFTAVAEVLIDSDPGPIDHAVVPHSDCCPPPKLDDGMNNILDNDDNLIMKRIFCGGKKRLMRYRDGKTEVSLPLDWTANVATAENLPAPDKQQERVADDGTISPVSFTVKP